MLHNHLNSLLLLFLLLFFFRKALLPRAHDNYFYIALIWLFLAFVFPWSPHIEELRFCGESLPPGDHRLGVEVRVSVLIAVPVLDRETPF